MTDREKAIKVLEDIITTAEGIKGLSDDAGITISLDKIESLKFALESIKVDRAYDLAYEKVDFIEIPEGVTNGDMIKAMFPSASETDHFILNSPIGNIIYIRLEKYQEMRVQEEWWNSPYRKEHK